MKEIDRKKEALTIPTAGLREYIIEIARRYGVSYVRTPSDDLAEVITRLSGDEVASDETKDLIVALRRANVIDGPTMVSLLGSYLDENRNV
ncbi:MAG: hypothetical protein WCP96_15310 [Methylococcaceae bacterium]